MRNSKNLVLCFFFVISMLFSGCEPKSQNSSAHLLTTNDCINISLSAPEGSGAIRSLTIRFTYDGMEKCDAIDEVSRIDLAGYDNEKKEQVFTTSDYDQDGIIDLIVYREFWFPDLNLAHPEVPQWPTVYEYDLKNGLVVASSKHKDYFEMFSKTSYEQLTADKEHMDDLEILAFERLIYAAEQIANGSFSPSSPYSKNHYEDVYELVKSITR